MSFPSSSFLRTGVRRAAANARILRSKTPSTRITLRYQSTEAGAGSAGGFSASHLASGVAGGAIVLIGGYAYYHTSGIKSLVDTAKSTKMYLAQAQEAVAQKAKNPNEALRQLRQLVQSYVGLIPGASQYVDATFDNLDEIAETHGEEASKIATSTYNELSELVKSNKDAVTTAGKILEVLRKRSIEVAELAKKAGGAWLDKYPQAKERLSGGWEAFSKLAEEKGPEAKKVYDDATKQVKGLFAKGVNSSSMEEAEKLIEKKTKELRDLSGHEGGDGDALGVFEGLIKQIPGGEKALEQAPNMSVLAEAVRSQSGDAKQLAEETYQDLLKVLKEKGEKAKKLADSTKDQAKTESQQK